MIQVSSIGTGTTCGTTRVGAVVGGESLAREVALSELGTREARLLEMPEEGTAFGASEEGTIGDARMGGGGESGIAMGMTGMSETGTGAGGRGGGGIATGGSSDRIGLSFDASLTALSPI